MGWDSIGSRVRALERATMPSGPFVFIDLPSTTEAERREAAARIAEARRAGREVVTVRITLGRTSPEE